jgi:G3E family GTPase
VAVLVNDFGSINIDAELVVGVEDDMISLANGCVCCQVRDDLMEAVDQLLARPQPIEYILLEASGVADPAGIFVTFNRPKFRDRIRLDSVICVVDADQFLGQQEYEGLTQLKLRQIGCADMVILKKVDLAGAEKLRQVHQWIDHHFNRIRIVETNYCDVPYEILMGVGRFDPAGQLLSADNQSRGNGSSGGHQGGNGHDTRHQAHQDHGQTLSTWSYETERSMSLEALREMAKKLAGNIYSCKGVVYAADAPERRAVLQVVVAWSSPFMLIASSPANTIMLNNNNTFAKISVGGAIVYHVISNSPKKESRKDTIAHGRYNSCTAMFRPMSE